MNIIQEKISTLFITTDQRNWQKLEECFASKVILDYSSMTGQVASEITAQAIIESWKSILPGFAHTHHQLGNFIIKEQNGKASAFCYGTASHYLENEQENVWTVVGTYNFDLEKNGSDWKISKMKFNFKYQSGNLELPQLAIKRLTSASTTSLSSTGEQNKQAVGQFFKALENGNVDELISLFAEEGRQVNPYHSGLLPSGATGKKEIRDYWTPVFPNFEGMEFPIDEIYAMEDPSIVYVKYKGIIKLKNDAGYYKNEYYSTFRFNAETKIIEYVEIFNPITAARSFGLLDKIK